MTVTASGVGKSYVLVHGRWHGAWAFGRVAPLLVLEGHQVLASSFISRPRELAHILLEL